MDEVLIFAFVDEKGVTIQRVKKCCECGEFYSPEKDFIFHEWQSVGDEVV